MNRPIPVPAEDMNRWAVELRWIGAHVRKAFGIFLRRSLLDEELSNHLLTAARRAAAVQNGLIQAGADDPRETDRRDRPARREGVPLHLLSSQAAKEYAEAIRAAAAACRKMEEERGIAPEDGMTGILEDYARSAAFDVYGPAGLDGTN